MEDDKISKIGHFELKEDVDEVIDCKGKIIMPGLVNTHVHTSQQLGPVSYTHLIYLSGLSCFLF